MQSYARVAASFTIRLFRHRVLISVLGQITDLETFPGAEFGVDVVFENQRRLWFSEYSQV